MLKALLVDDEPLALEGLRLLIDWQAEGFTICGECASAYEALEMLPHAGPDLIVTDIRMPGMSGLELLSAAREAGYGGQFVIVSGYSDFYYARKALQIGVAGYLVKPVDPAEASSVLAHVRRKLIDQEAKANRQARITHHAITELLTGCGAPAVGLPAAARWILATWGAPLPYPAVQELLSLFAAGTATAHIVEDKEYLVLRTHTEAEPPEFQKARALLRRHRRQLNIGNPTGSPENLASLRKQMSDRLDTACRQALIKHMDALVHMVALRQADECAERCAELEAFCAAYGTNAATYARRQLLSSCSSLLANRSDALQTFLRSQDAGFETLCTLAIRLLAPEQERVSDRVEHYAQEHAGEHITLSGVAAALGYNATYLGRKFCEERGTGFRDWLTGRRMEQSAALLRGTNRSVNAIARAVGYEHYKRFLQHFKRRFGVAPEQYRRQRPE